jgi:hypothetical protein
MKPSVEAGRTLYGRTLQIAAGVLVVAACLWLGDATRPRPAIVTSAPAAAPSPAPPRAPAPASAPARVADPEPPATLDLTAGSHAKAIKIGLIVPDGYTLPPGYARLAQTNDEGEPLPPILVFQQDWHPVDGNGRAIPIGEDRIVPPELAPAGMPLQMLEPR